MTDGQAEVASQNPSTIPKQPCDGTCGRHDEEEPPTLESESRQAARQMGSDNPPLGVADPRDCQPPSVEEVLDCVGNMLDRMQTALSTLTAHLRQWEIDAETLSGELSVGHLAQPKAEGGQ